MSEATVKKDSDFRAPLHASYSVIRWQIPESSSVVPVVSVNTEEDNKAEQNKAYLSGQPTSFTYNPEFFKFFLFCWKCVEFSS